MRVILVALLLWLSPQSGWAQQQQQADREEITVPAPSSWLVDQANKTGDHDKPCKPGEDDRNSDLCAQWKAADAAKESADWTRKTYWLVLVGTIIGFITFCAAVAAAIFAKHASDHTKAGADAAKDAVEEARRIGHAQLRPYAVYDRADTQILTDERGTHKRLEIDISFRNCGATPGILSAASNSTYAPDGSGRWSSQGSSWRPVRIVIGPGQVEKVRFPGIPADKNGSFTWFTVGILIWYEDLAGVKFEEHVWLTFDGTGARQDYHSAPGQTLYRPSE